MTVVYRAYSPSRDRASSPTDSQPYAVGVATSRNQYCTVDDTTPDWTVQAGVVSWDEETDRG